MGSSTGAGSSPNPASALATPGAEMFRWRRVFPGESRKLGELRRWLATLLPDCSARDDVACVATELGSNALQHTASGRGGWFAVEWADVPWSDPGADDCTFSHDPYEAAVRAGQEDLARRCAGVPAWFGRSTLTWWALAGPNGLMTASTAAELADVLTRLRVARASQRAGRTRATGGRPRSGIAHAM